MKRLTCWLLLSLLPCVYVHAQYDGMSVDTLEQMLKNPPQAERELFYIYVKLVQGYKRADLGKAMDYNVEP